MSNDARHDKRHPEQPPPDQCHEDGNPLFDDSRIKHHPDKVLLGRIRLCMKAFTTGDQKILSEIHTDDFVMTDIPLGVVNAPLPRWNEVAGAFTSNVGDLHVQAISLYGSSAPGQFAIMEHVVWFRIPNDPAEAFIGHLPPGAKAGDKVGMVNLDVLWWNKEGKVYKEMVYGRLVWKDFDVKAVFGEAVHGE